MKYPWNHTRRFNAYSNYLKNQFGHRIQKVSIDAGFTCPNRDGTKGYGGCSFCNNNAFNPSYCNASKPILTQIEEGIYFHKKRYKNARKYLAYFQAYSNTYSPIDQLKEIYEPALHHPDICGIVVGTRPDCIDEEKLQWFAELAKETHLIIEYGIESCYNKTLEKINRRHTFEESAKAIELTRKYNIKTGGHIIFGLPEESLPEMIEMANLLSRLPVNNLKFHQLQIVKNTKMALEYEKHPERFHEFSMESYLDFMVDFIEQLRPDIVIERIAGEAPPDYNLGKRWNMRYDRVLKLFEEKLKARDTWQGKFYKKIE